MSANFPGGTFAYQKVTPSEDAAVRGAILGDGILYGCEFSYSGSTLTMGAGLLFVCGRIVRHPQAQHWPVTGAKSGYARLILTVDLSRTATADAFDQVVDSIDYAVSQNGFSQLTQDGINAGGVRYQCALCVVSLGAAGITGITESLGILGAGKTIQEVTSLQQLDGLRDTATYRMNIRSGAATVCGVNFSRSTVSVQGYDESSAVQILSLIDNTTRAVRSCDNGVWRPWGLENPPMVPGVEYRTTELFNGQPVYIKRISYAANQFTAQQIERPHGIDGIAVCLSADVIWKRTDKSPDGWRFFPAADYTDYALLAQVRYVSAEAVCFQMGSNILSALRNSTEPIYVTLKYTKQ